MADNRAWMVRAGNDNELTDQFDSQSWVAIGWPSLGNLSEFQTRAAVKERYAEVNEKHSPNKLRVNAGQLHRFVNVMDEGDLVVTYDKSTREYRIGTVIGPYEYCPDGAHDAYPHIRRVNWVETVDRDVFSRPVRNTLGSSLTVFSLDDIHAEIEAVLSDDRMPDDPDADEDEDQPPFHEEVESKADELISDFIAHIDAEAMEELTAALLRAMGYHANTTGAGADHGVDIRAHPDALGFEDPLIKVQVKHRDSKTGSGDLRDFIGTLGTTDKGLFVSTGGYTRSAEEEAKRTAKRVTLIDRDRFLELLLAHYAEIEAEYTTLIPLKQIYVPTAEP